MIFSRRADMRCPVAETSEGKMKMRGMKVKTVIIKALRGLTMERNKTGEI